MIQEIQQTIRAIDPDAEIYLFGSRAKDSANKNSDWDILVLINNKENIKATEREIINKLYDLEVEKEVAINPIVYARQDWEGILSSSPLHDNIEEEGIKI